MRIIVTGGAGFIGSNLIRFLLRNTDYEVVNIDKLSYAGNLNSLKDIESSENYKFVQMDISNSVAIENLLIEEKPNAILHLAAESHVDRSIDGPEEFIKTNIIGSFALLEASRKLYNSYDGIAKKIFRLIHVSTDEVFGSLLPNEPGFEETSRYNPHSPYSASKAASDHLVRAWHDTYDLPIIVTNCSNNYGPFQFPEKLVPVIVLKCLKEQHIPIYGCGENIRDWLYVEDHVSALFTVLKNGKIGESYNIGGNNEMRNIDLVNMICEIVDRLAPRKNKKSYKNLIKFVADRPGHDMRYAINAAKIKNELDWSPCHDPRICFEKTVEWYINNVSWWESILNGTYKLQRIGKI